jgi:hypothetical protein
VPLVPVMYYWYTSANQKDVPRIVVFVPTHTYNTSHKYFALKSTVWKHENCVKSYHNNVKNFAMLGSRTKTRNWCW